MTGASADLHLILKRVRDGSPVKSAKLRVQIGEGRCKRRIPGMGENGVPGMGDHGVLGMGEYRVPGMGEHRVPGMGEHGVPGR